MMADPDLSADVSRRPLHVGPDPRSRRDVFWALARPYIHQAWLNLGIWLPFLENPPARTCRVSYFGREHRQRGVWGVVLPEQCWHCGQTETLHAVQYEFSLRAFENGLQIVFAGVATALLLLFMAFVLGSKLLFLLAGVELLGMVGLLVLKSWVEPVRLRIWTCEPHAAELVRPDAAVDDEQLHVYLPTVTLAEAARQDLQNSRRQRGRTPSSADETAGDDARGPRPARGGRPNPDEPETPYYRPPPKELPPIKLAGDE